MGGKRRGRERAREARCHDGCSRLLRRPPPCPSSSSTPFALTLASLYRPFASSALARAFADRRASHAQTRPDFALSAPRSGCARAPSGRHRAGPRGADRHPAMASKGCLSRLQKEYKALLKVRLSAGPLRVPLPRSTPTLDARSNARSTPAPPPPPPQKKTPGARPPRDRPPDARQPPRVALPPRRRPGHPL